MNLLLNVLLQGRVLSFGGAVRLLAGAAFQQCVATGFIFFAGDLEPKVGLKCRHSVS